MVMATEEKEKQGEGLKRVLGFGTIWLITVQLIVGSGLFLLPAIGASYSGPASIISWIILAAVSLYTASCFGELGSMFPKAGGIYEFSKETYGRFPSFIIGWMGWLIGNITTAMLIAGGVLYLLPSESSSMNFLKIISCIGFLIMFNYIAYRGVETSAAMLVIFACITLFTVAALIILSFVNFDAANLMPFFVHEGNLTNISMIILTIFFICETFFGVESVLPLAEETKNPEKVIPKALVMGYITVGIIAVVLVTASLGAFHWTEFSKFTAPYAEVAGAVLGNTGAKVITLLTYLVMLGAASGWVVTTPRLLLALSRDRVFPPQFEQLHPKYRSPYKGIIFQTIVEIVLILIAFSSNSGYKTLLHLLVPLALIQMAIVLLCVPILRVREPHKERPFKVIFGKIGPVIVFLFYLGLVGIWLIKDSHALDSFLLCAAFVAIGIPIYLLIQMYYNPKAISKVSDSLAYFTLFTESYSLPTRIREALLFLLGDLRGKKILEYGCSVGTMTLALAQEVGQEGVVFATDHSRKALHIVKKRLQRKGHLHVHLLHDDEHTIRVHPQVPQVDLVVSIGTLGYVQEMERVLLDFNNRLPLHGKICFLDYDNYFGIIPNVDWLSKNQFIKDLFEKTGFQIEITRKEGLFWQYIFIYGEKVCSIDEHSFHYDASLAEMEQHLHHIPVKDSESIPTSGKIVHPLDADEKNNEIK